MPELPEVETIARGMQARLAGLSITNLWQGEHTLRLSSKPAELEKALTGAQIGSVRRVGKQIVVSLGEPDGSPRADWEIHLGMTGRISLCPPEQPQLPHTHLIASLSDGSEVRYSDPRRFGRLQVMAPGASKPPGEEPLEIGVERFVELFHRRHSPIKSALLNQQLLSGIGNIYADESLFRAGIRPSRRASSLSRVELTRLHTEIQKILGEAITAGGSSISDYVDAEGRAGFFQFEHRVYQRSGKPCTRCHALIRRLVIGGRSSSYCPNCQK